jgi:hypothetical protein
MIFPSRQFEHLLKLSIHLLIVFNELVHCFSALGLFKLPLIKLFLETILTQQIVICDIHFNDFLEMCRTQKLIFGSIEQVLELLVSHCLVI